MFGGHSPRRKKSSYGVENKNQLDEKNVCGKCCKRVMENQEGISCDCCSYWFHTKCMTISKPELEMLGRDNIMWLCKKCEKESRNLQEENRKMRETNKELIEENNALKSRLNTIENEIKEIKLGLYKQNEGENSNMKEYIDIMRRDFREEMVTLIAEMKRMFQQNIEENVQDKIKKEIFESIQEENDKSKRENNLILHNVDESEKELGKSRENDDTQRCNEIFKDGTQEKDYEIEKVIRLGKRNNNGKPRPILVKFTNKNDKYKILTKTKNLKNAPENMKKVIITPDLTLNERKLDKELRLKLKEKRENGENDWYIFRGELKRRNFQ